MKSQLFYLNFKTKQNFEILTKQNLTKQLNLTKLSFLIEFFSKQEQESQNERKQLISKQNQEFCKTKTAMSDYNNVN